MIVVRLNIYKESGDFLRFPSQFNMIHENHIRFSKFINVAFFLLEMTYVNDSLKSFHSPDK